MFDLSNLNDYEFEILCKDIMEKRLVVNLHRFPRGRDGGVDLCDSQTPMKYMIQVKHYMKSTFNSLLSILKNEVEKVKRNNPKEYYLCCSMDLTRENKETILSFFPNYMKDISYIIDKIEINDFLSKEENRDIVEKHYKLWLCSSNVLSLINNQNCFIDCEALISDINEYIKLFVETNAFYECRNKLLKNNVIIIIGEPGVGKSTISKMLLLFFASNKYLVRYVTDNEIKSIKNILNKNPSVKEIILLDDFLGQHYLNVYNKQPNELKSLISFVEKNPNKKIIMNSRITIINEAHSSSLDFANLIDKYDKDNYLIDLNKMSFVEKAKILYNHFYFNELPVGYLQNMKENRNYVRIIKHQNYNPRIIEYVTKIQNYRSVTAEEYTNYILSKLDNPESVWEDEFRNRLQEEDRVFMNTLYSLTNSKINLDILRCAFNKRIMTIRSNTTINMFEEIMHRLTNSLIKIIVEKGKRYVCVVNPSINDYLCKKIESNTNEQIAIIKSAQYIEQVMKFHENKETIYDIVYNNKISSLNSIVWSNDYHYFSLIIEYELKDLKIKEYVKSIFSKFCNEFLTIKEYVFIDLIKKGFIKFYGLESIITDNLANIARGLSYNKLLIFFDWYKKERIELNEDELSEFHDCFISAIEEHVIDSINDDLNDIIDEEIEESSFDYYNDSILKENIEKSVENLIDNRVTDLLDGLPLAIELYEIDLSYILSSIVIDEAIDSYFDDESNLLEEEFYKENNLTSETVDEWAIIDHIFN